MALKISSAAIIEKNKLADDGAWLILLEIRIPGLPEPIRVVRNTDDIPWPAVGPQLPTTPAPDGDIWQAFPFELDEIGEDSKGEVPSVGVRISNITKEVQGYVEQANGGAGSTVIFRVVHSKHLDITTPEVEEVFTALDVTCNDLWATFNLGMDYPTFSRRPIRRYLMNFCDYDEYGGAECGVSYGVLAQYPTCNRTLLNCRQRGNSARFGGEPSIPAMGIYV